MTTILLLILLCLVFSAFFSGSEMAFISANKLKFRSLADQGNPGARKVLRLQEKPQQLLTAILIGNNVVNATATALLAYGLETHYGVQSEWLVTAVMAPTLLIFGEMVPKDYCRFRSEGVLLKYANGLDLFVKLLRWPSVLILRAVDFLLAPLGSAFPKSIFVSEEEFRSLIEEGARSGALESHEKKIIDTILDFERVRLHTVMTPLDKVTKVELTARVADVKALVAKTHARMVLVYEEIPSIIVGVVYVFDLLFEEDEQQTLKSFLRAPVFLPAAISVEEAFLTLQKKRQSFAVVTDAKGEAVGVAPIEKLLAL